jgi:hypothetical protein
MGKGRQAMKTQDMVKVIEASRRDPMCSNDPDSLNYWRDDAACSLRDHFKIPLGHAMVMVDEYANHEWGEDGSP